MSMHGSRKALFVFITLIVLLAVGCAEPKGTPTEFGKACDQANDKQYLEVGGVLAERGSVFCSNTSGRMECGFDLLETAGGDKKLRVDIEQGSGANTIDKLVSGYKEKDIKIRDNAGQQIVLGKDKVRLTGKMTVAPGTDPSSGVCFMQVTKIER